MKEWVRYPFPSPPLWKITTFSPCCTLIFTGTGTSYGPFLLIFSLFGFIFLFFFLFSCIFCFCQCYLSFVTFFVLSIKIHRRIRYNFLSVLGGETVFLNWLANNTQKLVHFVGQRVDKLYRYGNFLVVGKKVFFLVLISFKFL
jgi:hypothetical protein